MSHVLHKLSPLTIPLAYVVLLLAGAVLAWAEPAAQYQATRLGPGQVVAIDPSDGTVVGIDSTRASVLFAPTPQPVGLRVVASLRHGLVVGSGPGPDRPFETHALVLDLASGVLTDLGLTGGSAERSNATAVNAAPTCAGFGDSPANDESSLPLLWPACRPPATILQSLGGSLSAVRALSDADDACGFSLTADFETHAACWLGGQRDPTDLQTLPARISFAVGVSPTGGAALIVVGTLSQELPGPSQGFRWQANTGMVLLPPLPDQVSSQAEGVNDAGDVVGSSSTPDPAMPGLLTSLPTLWGLDGVPIDLEARTLGLPDGCELDLARGIGSGGAIIVNGTCDGVATAFLLTPVEGAVVTEPPPAEPPRKKHHLHRRHGQERMVDGLARAQDRHDRRALRRMLDQLLDD